MNGFPGLLDRFVDRLTLRAAAAALAAAALGAAVAGPTAGPDDARGLARAVALAGPSGLVAHATVLAPRPGTRSDPSGSGLLLRDQRVRIERCLFDPAGRCDPMDEVLVPLPVGVWRRAGGRPVATRILTGSTAMDVNTLRQGDELLLVLAPRPGDAGRFRVVPTRAARRPVERRAGGPPLVRVGSGRHARRVTLERVAELVRGPGDRPTPPPPRRSSDPAPRR